MDYKQFIEILKDETTVPNSVGILNEFVNEFPYFQTAHSLLAREMYNQQHVRYERQLKIAAAYSPDRKALHALIHPKKVNLFSTEAAIEHPHLVEENVEMIPPSENLFEDRSIEIIPHDESPVIVHHAPEEEKPVIHFHEQNFDDELDFSPAEEELPPADPHEIIRRRLNEILGLHQPEQNNTEEEKVVAEKKVVEEKVIEPGDIVVEEIVEPYSESDEIIQEIPATIFEENTPDLNQKIETVEVKNSVPGKKQEPEDIIEKIAAESTHAIDVIEKGEFEYALEASLIQSLEKLPLIEKPSFPSKFEETKRSTFIDWLRSKSGNEFGKIEEVHAYEDEPVKAEIVQPVEIKKPDTVTLIDKFIREEPKIVVSKTEFYSPSVQAKRSIIENEDIVSETLAKIYHQQGNVIKARSSYEKLGLLYPEKKAYFAALISAIDKEINQQNKQDL